MILIYAKQAGPRLDYILHEPLTRRLGHDYRITSDLEEVTTGRSPVINYSHTTIAGALHILPADLLAESFISEAIPHVEDDGAWHKILFRTEGTLPFDVFSAAFYLLSRYEEYIPSAKDEHGRFCHWNSLAAKHGFLHMALVDRWCVKLAALLNIVPVRTRHLRAETIVDIDFAYKYRGTGTSLFLLKAGRAWLEMRWKDLGEAIRVALGSKADPYDSYGMLAEVCKDSGIPFHYFILMSSQGGRDKNLDPESPLLKKVVNDLSPGRIGIHPSYYSHDHSEELEHEMNLLSQIAEAPVTTSRQHFLRLTLPDTYKALLDAGIKEDYSMQYNDMCGFRASTAWPYRFFDLQNNTTHDLLIHPVCAMDVTLRDYMKLSPEQALHVLAQLQAECEAVNGTLITAWHNSSFNVSGGWKGWEEIFRIFHGNLAVRK